jgi:hypothetical protein
MRESLGMKVIESLDQGPHRSITVRRGAEPAAGASGIQRQPSRAGSVRAGLAAAAPERDSVVSEGVATAASGRLGVPAAGPVSAHVCATAHAAPSTAMNAMAAHGALMEPLLYGDLWPKRP